MAVGQRLADEYGQRAIARLVQDRREVPGLVRAQANPGQRPGLGRALGPVEDDLRVAPAFQEGRVDADQAA